MQNDWTEGYVRELGYRHQHHAELAPGLLGLACLSRGVISPLGHRPPRYLELGYGQGVSLNVHAAACAGEYWGIDFNPAHAANALDLAAASGSGARPIDDSFADFAARRDDMQFDVIAMHGTWSWISAENRHLVVEIVRRKLAPGGLFYVSYNCWPGWAAEMPLRHLLVQHAERSVERRDLATRIEASLDFAQALLEADAAYFKQNARLKDSLTRIRGRNRNYVAHEYFNRDWHPMPFSDVAQALTAAKLEFAASATLTDHLDHALHSEKARALLAGTVDPVLRETVLDYLVNRTFRRDIFVKGLRRMPATERESRLRGMAFALLQHPDHVPLKVKIGAREASLLPEVYRPLIETMAEGGYAPKTLGEVSKHPRCAGLNFAQLVQAAVILTGAGSLHPAQGPASIAAAVPHCKALNDFIIEQATRSDEMSALACPVTGAGVFVERLELLFLRAIAKGRQAPRLWAAHALECLKSNSERISKDGKPLGSEEETLARLSADAEAFERIRLPVLKALKVA